MAQSDWGGNRVAQGIDHQRFGAFIHGNGVPHTGLGSVGSWYIDHDTNYLVGPKGTDGWPTTPAWVIDVCIVDNLRYFGYCPPECEYGIAGDYYVQVNKMPPLSFGPHDGTCFTEIGNGPTTCFPMPTAITEEGLVDGNTPLTINAIRRVQETGLLDQGELLKFSFADVLTQICITPDGIAFNTGNILPGAAFTGVVGPTGLGVLNNG